MRSQRRECEREKRRKYERSEKKHLNESKSYVVRDSTSYSFQEIRRWREMKIERQTGGLNFLKSLLVCLRRYSKCRRRIYRLLRLSFISPLTAVIIHKTLAFVLNSKNLWYYVLSNKILPHTVILLFLSTLSTKTIQ